MRARIIGWLLLAAAFVLSGCGSNGETSQQFLSQALKYHKKGNDDAAIVDLKNAIQKDPSNGQARYILAVIHNERGEGSAAEIELQKALQLGVSKEKVDAALGEALLLQGKYQKVVDDVKPSGSLEGEFAAGIYTARGNAFLGLGDIDKARSSFKHALKEDPDYSDAHLGVARLAARKNDLSEALHQTGIALSESPRNVLGWNMKGDLLRAAKKDEDARAAYHKALEVDKSNIPARLSLISMDAAVGKFDSAQSQLDSAEKIAPKDLRLMYMQALLNFRKGRYAEALAAVQDVMKGAPDFMPGVLLKGLINYELGSYEQAHKDLSAVLLQFPGTVYATEFLVATDLRMGRVSEAIKKVDALLSDQPKDPQVLALAGQAYMQAKKFSKATDFLKKAAQIDPKDAQLHLQLAVSRLNSGEKGLALTELSSAVALDPKLFKADALMVATWLGEKEFDRALKAARSWQKKQPDNPVVYNLEGMAFLGKADRASARKSFEQALTAQAGYFPAANNLAQMDLQDNHPRAAKKRLERILKADKNNLNAQMALAGLAQAAHRDSEVEMWLEKAIAAHPSDMQPRQLLVSHYMNTGQWKKALVVARDAQSDNPNDPDALDLLGRVQLAAGKKGSALDTYAKVVNLLPSSPVAFLKLAQAQEAAGKMSDAEASLKQALELKPKYIDASIALVSLKTLSGRYKEALEIARKIQKQYPKSPTGLDLEGNVLMQQKKYSQAISAYEGAYDVAPNANIVGQIYHAYVAAGMAEKGVAALRQRIDSDPSNIATQLALAQVYTAQHHNGAAISRYKAILKKSPGNVSALNNLAWLYSEEGNSQALEIAEQAYKLAPNSPDTNDTLGWILLGEGEIKRGFDRLKRALSLSPGDPTIGYHYAVALAKAGKSSQARKQLQDLLSSGRSFPERVDAKKLLKRL